MILFFKDGRIAARGTHEGLFASFPEYAELVRLQFPDTVGGAEAMVPGAAPAGAYP
jgi:hypothetical protein